MLAFVLSLALAFGTAGNDGQEAESPPSLDCSYGGFEREFGGTQWTVFGCSDRKTIVIFTSKGNPAGPFYFIRYPKDDTFGLAGEGNGDKAYTSAAFEQLKAMSNADWSELLAELNSAPKVER